MNPQDLQTGHEYLIRAKFDHKDYDDDYNFIAEPSESLIFLDAKSVRQSVLQSLEPPTSVGTPSKYDPCRLFRKGDVAVISHYKGRAIIPIDLKVGDKVKVCENEEAGASFIHVIDPIGRRFFITPPFLELVTPVEELERYIIIHNEREKYYDVCWKDDDEPDGRTGRTRVRATFWYNKPPQTYSQTEALSAAETERARLNAEHRKENQ